jgi:GntR family transcriptional regulator/MocR family aminotransferase
MSLDRAAGRLSAQVAVALRSAIRAGRLRAGTRLPSTRDLAHDLQVSRGVVVNAYEQLLAEGFLVARHGDGTRVAPLAVPELPRPASSERAAAGVPAAPADAGRFPGGERITYDLRPGAPDLSAFPRALWLSALRQALRTLPNSALDYPDPAGALELRVELAGYLGRVRAAHAGPDQIVVTNGVAQGLYIIIRLLVAEGGRRLAIEDPTSPRQLPLLRATGVELIRVPVDAEGLDVAALARTGARAVLVTPAHQYPTGVVLSPRRRAALIAWAREVDGIVIEDDYDAEFRYDREPVGCLQGVEPGQVVLTGSVSKSLAPGLRLGWVVAPRWLAARARDFRADTDLGAPVIEQHALVDLIASGGYDRRLRAMRRVYRTRRDALAAALSVQLPGATVRGVSAGLHLYVELPDGVAEEAVVAAAAERGVAIAPAAPMWSGGQTRPALVLGYSRLGPSRLAEAAELLGQVITRGEGG